MVFSRAPLRRDSDPSSGRLALFPWWEVRARCPPGAASGAPVRTGKGAGARVPESPPEPAPRPRPCPAPTALSVPISANRLQTERARRGLNAIGALPGAQATLPARPPPGAARPGSPRPAGRPAPPALLGPRPSATRRSPAPARAAQPAAARRGTRDRGAAGHLSAPCAPPGRGVPGRPWLRAQRESGSEFEVQKGECPGRLPGLLEAAPIRAGGQGAANGTGRVPAPGKSQPLRVPAPPSGGERERANEGRAAWSRAGPTGRTGAVSTSQFCLSSTLPYHCFQFFFSNRSARVWGNPASAQGALAAVSRRSGEVSGGASRAGWPSDRIFSFHPRRASECSQYR